MLFIASCFVSDRRNRINKTRSGLAGWLANAPVSRRGREKGTEREPRTSQRRIFTPGSVSALAGVSSFAIRCTPTTTCPRFSHCSKVANSCPRAHTHGQSRGIRGSCCCCWAATTISATSVSVVDQAERTTEARANREITVRQSKFIRTSD